MKRTYLLIFLFISAIALNGQDCRGYYDGITDQTGDDLKEALHDIVKGHTVKSYDYMWTAYGTTDLDANSKIWDIYSNYRYTLGTNQCGTYTKEGDCYNREHLWAQSWTNNDATEKTDLHHVFPTDGYVNNRRGNYPFGEVSSPTYTSGNGGKLGPNTVSGYDGTVFEPVDEYKGDIARALMYVSVRYYNEDSEWSTTSGMTNKSVINDWAMAMLLDWNDNDPVSAKEIARNEAVYGIQKNRNPFIDHPEYARRIWDPYWTGSNQVFVSAYPKTGGEIGLPTKKYKTVSIDFSKQGYSDGQAISSAAINDTVSVVFSKGSNDSNAPKYYTTGTAIRCYGGNYFTVSTIEGCSITKITLTYGGTGDGSNAITTNVVTFDGTNTWNGDASSVKFTIGGTSGNRRIKGIEVKYSYYGIVTPHFTDADIDFSAQGYTNEQVVSSATIDANVTVSFDKGTNNNAPKYYTSGSAIRCYGGNTFKLDAGSNVITSVKLTYGSGDGSNAITTDVGTFATDTWSGHASSVTFTIGGSSGHRRIKKIAVEYSDQQINFVNGSTLTLSAMPSDGYSFVNWTKDGVHVSGDATFSLSVTDDANYVANFMNNTVSANTTVAALTLNGTVTVSSGKTLTVTGAITQPEGSTIVLNNSAQLINSTADITGKVKKNITKWAASPVAGWHAISSPVVNTAFANVTNLTSSSYNVYRLNETNLMWENSQDVAGGHSFSTFANGRGYLYRKGDNTAIEFNGVLNYTDVDYTLTYTSSVTKGFHLIGNPYPHNIYKGAGAAIPNTYLEDGFYTLTSAGGWVAGTDNLTAIAPCQAILVQAKNTVSNNILSITKTTAQSASKENDPYMIFSVAGNNYEDVAYAMIKDGHGLNKIEHRNEAIQKLYINRDGEDFAIADIDADAGVFNLNFHATATAIYTMKIKTTGDFSYLHLVDNFTGEDLDLLLDDEYSFIGSSTDKDNRFIVKFKDKSSAHSETNTFAYQNGDEIVIDGEGELQIFDVMGRMVVSRHVSGVETQNIVFLQKGIYIMKLDEKTQKIVVK